MLNNIDQQLFDASSSGNLEKVIDAIINGADVYGVPGVNALKQAILNGHLNIVKCFSEQGFYIHFKDSEGRTPLFWAVMQGYFDIVKYLRNQGAYIHLVDNEGLTPLHWAVIKGYLNIIEYLVTEGADINAKNIEGYTPFEWAVECGNLNIVQYLVKIIPGNYDYGKAVVLALTYRHHNLADYLLKEMRSKNIAWTPLHHFAYCGYLDGIKEIIESDNNNIYISINCKDPNGHTPLCNAIGGKQPHIVKFLLENGANPFFKHPCFYLSYNTLGLIGYISNLPEKDKLTLFNIIKRIWEPYYTKGALVGMFMPSEENQDKCTLIPVIAARIATFVDSATARNVALTCKAAAQSARESIEKDRKMVNKKHHRDIDTENNDNTQNKRQRTFL